MRGTLQVRPCKLGRRIHAAHAPATGPTPPSTVGRVLSEHGVIALGVRSVFRRKTDLTPDVFRYLTAFIHAWRGSTVSTKVDTYQDQQRQPLPTAAQICRGWGGVGWQDRWRHGWRHRAPMGEGALLAKHCFASARTHSRQRLGRTAERDSRRLPQPDRPRHPSECTLLLLLLRLPASGRHYRGCRVQPCKEKGRLSAASLFFTSA